MTARVISRIMVPKNDHILIPGTYEYTALYRKRDFTDLIMNPEMGRFYQIEWPQYNNKTEGRGPKSPKKGDVTMKPGVRMMHLEDGGRLS